MSSFNSTGPMFPTDTTIKRKKIKISIKNVNSNLKNLIEKDISLEDSLTELIKTLYKDTSYDDIIKKECPNDEMLQKQVKFVCDKRDAIKSRIALLSK